MALPICWLNVDYNMGQQILCARTNCGVKKMGTKSAFRDMSKKHFSMIRTTYNESKFSHLFRLSFFCAKLNTPLHQDHLQSIHRYVQSLDDFVCGSEKNKRNRE